jgi:hypothetical protein
LFGAVIAIVTGKWPTSSSREAAAAKEEGIRENEWM